MDNDQQRPLQRDEAINFLVSTLDNIPFREADRKAAYGALSSLVNGEGDVAQAKAQIEHIVQAVYKRPYEVACASIDLLSRRPEPEPAPEPKPTKRTRRK